MYLKLSFPSLNYLVASESIFPGESWKYKIYKLLYDKYLTF